MKDESFHLSGLDAQNVRKKYTNFYFMISSGSKKSLLYSHVSASMLHVLGIEEVEIANFNYETGNIIRESTEPTEMKFVQYT